MLIEVCIDVHHSTPGANDVWENPERSHTPDRGQPDHMLPSIISGTAAERTKAVIKIFFSVDGVRERTYVALNKSCEVAAK